MTLWRLVVKSLREHAFSTWVTSVSIALAGGLLMSVWSVKEQSRESFTRVTGGYDAVLGARSSKLQLILSAIYHLEASPANIQWTDYEEVRDHPGVAHAFPLAMGDNYFGYRVVGAVPEMFTQVPYAPGRHYQVRRGGRLFEAGYKEATVGSLAARRLGLKVGDHFHPYHGLNFEEGQRHEEEEYLVVGILEPSNTPVDRVIWIPLEGVQHMAGHAEAAATEVSAVLVQLRSPVAGRNLETRYNKEGVELTFAWPIGATMAGLLDKIGWMERVLSMVAWLVACVAAGSVMASIYNSMNARQRQIALLRALGAHRRFIFCAVVLESILIAAWGAAMAFGVQVVIMGGAAAVIRAQTGIELSLWYPQLAWVWAPLGMLALGAVAGVAPAFKAYQVDVAEHLAP